MATITIGYKPELTPDSVRETFAEHFAGKYEVYPTKVRSRDFIVKKSGWSGVGVRVKQEKEQTTFVFTAMMPNLFLQALFGGLATYLFLRSDWKALESEVADFIQYAPEFQPQREQQAKAA